MASLFETINLIHSKDHYPSEDELKEYSSFMGNRAMSQFQELIFYAEIMNENWSIPKEVNFSFYFYGISKKKRFTKWAKKETDDEKKIKLLKEYYGYSTLKAREILPIIDQLNLWEKINDELDKGGAGKKKKNKSHK